MNPSRKTPAHWLVTLAAGCALTWGCGAQPSASEEIVDNLIQAGFPADDITFVGDAVYVGGDAEVSLQASREMLETAGTTTQEQYRTNNTVSSSVTKICVSGPDFTGVFSTALDMAIQNYDELPLTFSMARAPSTGCSFTIQAVIDPKRDGGSAGFPSNGLPGSTIIIGGLLSSYSVDTIEHVITHELGHTIGLRHTDYYNSQISCGPEGGNEGQSTSGAIHIPGTPTNAVVGGSVMNACFRDVETGELTDNDIKAVYAMYPRPGEDLRWSFSGPLAGMRHCTQLSEPADSNGWHDNYLCSNVDYGFAWNNAGTVSGMNCTLLLEASDPNTWNDNNLCLPQNSTLNLSWSSTGLIAGKSCVQLLEPSDPHTWYDNFLCY